jgi:DNA-binding CsgD family transcriptional regulator
VRPQGLRHYAGANLQTGDGIGGVLNAGRGSCSPYRQQDLDLLASLVPHIQSAIRTSRQLGGIDVLEHAESDALDAFVHAIVIVDSTARVMFANRAAEAMFTTAGGIGTTQRRLVGPTAPLTHLLHALIAKATRAERVLRLGGAVLLERAPPAGPLQVLVTPLGTRHVLPAMSGHERAAMLVLADSFRASRGLESRLTVLFGLTPAEARVACEIADGRGPRDIADGLRVKPSTVRTHLHHVFAKTATHGQVDLIRLIAQLAAFRID